MNEELFTALRILTALGCAIVAGFFLAFSSTVMVTLAQLEPRAGITAMQSINRTVLNPFFMLSFFGTALLAAILIWQVFSRLPQANAIFLMLGAAIYIFGSILVTILFNVPLNNTLEAIQANSPDSFEAWKVFLTNWVFWNHLRTGASFLAAVLLLAFQ